MIEALCVVTEAKIGRPEGLRYVSLANTIQIAESRFKIEDALYK